MVEINCLMGTIYSKLGSILCVLPKLQQFYNVLILDLVAY